MNEQDLFGEIQKTPRTPKQDSPEVALIYAAYPLKVARPKALIAIAKACQKIAHGELLAKTIAFARAWEKNGDLMFCPQPATWFNQERYMDDPSTWVPKRKPEMRFGKPVITRPSLVDQELERLKRDVDRL